MISANCNIIGQTNDPRGFVPCPTDSGLHLWAIIKKHTYSPIIFKHEYRCGENFTYSDMCILDVDNDSDVVPTYTLENAVNDFGDCTVLIATTKSHMIAKLSKETKTPIIAPRFRILIPWERRITCPYSYKKSMKLAQSMCEGADLATYDVGRQFYPSGQILHASGPGERMPVIAVPQSEIDEEIKVHAYERDRAVNRPLPPHIVGFLNHGVVFGGSRNNSVYITARSLIQKGFAIAEVEKMLGKSPFCRDGFKYSELLSSIKSAEKKERQACNNLPPVPRS